MSVNTSEENLFLMLSKQDQISWKLQETLTLSISKHISMYLAQFIQFEWL